MGSRTQDIRALTFPKTMIVKAALLCYLVLTPAVFSFTVPAVNSVAKKQSSEVEARQFSDDDIINYGIWGFIAGLSDYFIRNAVTASAATTRRTRKRSSRGRRTRRPRETRRRRRRRWRLSMKRKWRSRLLLSKNLFQSRLLRMPLQILKLLMWNKHYLKCFFLPKLMVQTCNEFTK